MVISNILPNKKDEDKTTMSVNVWFLRFLNKMGDRGEEYQSIIMRLITSKKLTSEDSAKLKREISNYEKWL